MAVAPRLITVVVVASTGAVPVSGGLEVVVDPLVVVVVAGTVVVVAGTVVVVVGPQLSLEQVVVVGPQLSLEQLVVVVFAAAVAPGLATAALAASMRPPTVANAAIDTRILKLISHSTSFADVSLWNTRREVAK